MAIKGFWLGILVLVLVFGLMVIGCSNGTTKGGSNNGGQTNNNNNNSGGTFTLTDIPSKYNGKYAILDIGIKTVPTVFGCKDWNLTTNMITGVKIENGKVSIPMWLLSSTGDSYSRYSGNDNFNKEIGVFIHNTEILKAGISSKDFEIIIDISPITFSKGNATKSWNDGTIIP